MSSGSDYATPNSGTIAPTVNGFNANASNLIYTDNGLILPKSISKQSYIIYK